MENSKKREKKRGTEKSPRDATARARAHKRDAEGEPLYVAGMGGSAGGLEAFERFFSIVPPNTDVSIPIAKPAQVG